MISRTQKFDCQFGNHYYKQKQQSSKRTHLQGTRKIGCTACVAVYSIPLYPEIHIGKEETLVLSCRQMKQKKKENIFQLRESIAKSKPLHLVEKHYVIIPGEEVNHAYHETHGATSYAQRVHPKLIEKIYGLASEGTNEAQEVKRALKHYMQHCLCVHVKPDVTDHAYYPTYVHNHIYLLNMLVN